MGANNQGIMHAAHRVGGEPLCRNRNAHMSTSIDKFRGEPLRCKRCQAKVEKIDSVAWRKAMNTAQAKLSGEGLDAAAVGAVIRSAPSVLSILAEMLGAVIGGGEGC